MNDTASHSHNKNETIIAGFWVFLMSDLLLFGLMFAIYLTMIGATAGGPGPKELFDFTSLAMQTLFLLVSSMTVGVASLAVKHKLKQSTVQRWLLATLFLGLGFLGLEILDFINMASDGGVPSRSGFLSAFYGIVPLHGFHVAMGCIWLTVIMVQISKFGLIDAIESRFMRFSLYWHFLDLIWIGVFTIVFFGGYTIAS